METVSLLGNGLTNPVYIPARGILQHFSKGLFWNTGKKDWSFIKSHRHMFRMLGLQWMQGGRNICGSVLPQVSGGLWALWEVG